MVTFQGLETDKDIESDSTNENDWAEQFGHWQKKKGRGTLEKNEKQAWRIIRYRKSSIKTKRTSEWTG